MWLLQGNELCMRPTTLHQKEFFSQLTKTIYRENCFENIQEMESVLFSIDVSFCNVYECVSLETFYFTRSV